MKVKKHFSTPGIYSSIKKSEKINLIFSQTRIYFNLMLIAFLNFMVCLMPGCVKNSVEPYFEFKHPGYLYHLHKNWKKTNAYFFKYRTPGTHWDRELKLYRQKLAPIDPHQIN